VLRVAVTTLCLAAAIAVPAAGGAPATVQTDVTIVAGDGAALAATLVAPADATHLPAILMLHGLGGKRQDLIPLAQEFAAAGYVVLAPDFRGHGASDGLTSIDGPREIQDVRELVAWLQGRQEVDPNAIGGWGISLGGGAILRAAVEGVPFAALETVDTWTNLYTAIAPQNLSKSGAVVSLLDSVPESRRSPELLAITPDALQSRNLPALRAFAATRSTAQLLAGLRTPLYMFQGRRDFAFDIAQATAAMRLVKGPHDLYVGDFGHAPSTFPGPDVAAVVSEGVRWFGRYLHGGTATDEKWVRLAPSPWRGKAVAASRLPATTTRTFALGGSTRIGPNGTVVRTTRLRQRLETFGAGRVRVVVRLSGGWPRLVAVLVARRRGADTIVSEGGVDTRSLTGRRTLTIDLLADATLIRPGSTLRLYLAAASTKQNPANLLYLDVGTPARARLAVGAASLRLPVLRRPVSR
jgi:predicted acyl esterase